MAELGKIEKPDAASFKEKRKLYVVPTLPFEEVASQFKIDEAKVERFWGEVRGKIEYFVSTYGDISILYLEGINEEENIGIEFFERFGKDSNHYRLIKSLLDRGIKIKGIEKDEYIELSRLLFEEYSRSFLPEVKELHEGFYGKNVDFDKWREYLVKRIMETQDKMSEHASKTIEETLGETGNGVLIITDGRPIEFPQGTDVFQIRPPSFDDIAKTIRKDYPQ
ncbi:hypothetical protein ANME2D_00124 [Candidatus Methanoperedens nitroreducens]|uniref:Uncharacterized protein n=1 Tax=Candidatus Methanoperedens nitratireducens TaxID=1392998 RepID=A0A062VCT3_9EURY|nr:hypothetical protein [Candidatus Methanoperedens nitroreducens]KCZ73065.1 hypothetical protein ANME2D_00124 [Candidatus Methanoperedens nitroreducens]MDJ1422989.1 hypothetical protein [Candidatus Methanoperedens sp.]